MHIIYSRTLSHQLTSGFQRRELPICRFTSIYWRRGGQVVNNSRPHQADVQRLRAQHGPRREAPKVASHSVSRIRATTRTAQRADLGPLLPCRYLTYADVSQLPTIDLDPSLRSIIIPPGMYRSAKARSRQVDLENTYAADSSRAGSMAASPVRLASPYPQLPAGYPASPAATPSPHPGYGLDYQALQAQQSPQVVARYPYAPVPMQQPMQQQLPQYPVGGQYAAAQYPATMSAAERAAQDRLTEDQRVISMLNSRTHM